MNIIQYPSGHIHPYPTGEDILDPLEPPFRVWIPEQPILVLGYSQEPEQELKDRKSTRLNSSHSDRSRMPSSA